MAVMLVQPIATACECAYEQPRDVTATAVRWCWP